MLGMFRATRALRAKEQYPLPGGTPQPPPAGAVQDFLAPDKKGLKVHYKRNIPSRFYAPSLIIGGVSAAMLYGFICFGRWVENDRSVVAVLDSPPPPPPSAGGGRSSSSV